MVIGITGGVGCGKSTVMSIMREKYGYTLLEADKIGHMLMKPGQSVYNKIIEHFGDGILDKDSEIDRKKLGEIVFSDEKELEFLNSLIHPGVREYIENRIKNALPNENFLIEAALLIEAGYKDVCDEMWYIYADKEVRAKRLKESRGYSDEKIRDVMNNQLSEEEFRKNTNRVIDNNESIQNTTMQIKKIVEF